MPTKVMQLKVEVVSGYEGETWKQLSVVECSHSGYDCFGQYCPAFKHCCSKGRVVKVK